MRKSQKLMITSVVLALLALLTVAPTLSWLSDMSRPVINTFAGGAISIKLDEALVGTDGKQLTGDDAQRVTTNSYKYLPGALLDKDPTPTVLKGSEECYVFLCVENHLSDKFTMDYREAWIPIAEGDGKTVYAYHQKVNAAEADVKLEPIFTHVQVSAELTSEEIAELGERILSITAFAVQTASLPVKDAADLAVSQFLPDLTASVYPEIA